MVNFATDLTGTRHKKRSLLRPEVLRHWETSPPLERYVLSAADDLEAGEPGGGGGHGDGLL